MISENNSSSFHVNNSQNLMITNQLPISGKKNSIQKIKTEIKDDYIQEPLGKYESQVIPLEKKLFKNLNLEWGEDIISENIPLIEDKNYYYHLVRTAKPDPEKDNFFLIHGFISSGMHFISILPYLIKHYNVFIPDTIGMGLSARPQVEFSSPIDCEEYFLKIYHVIIESIFFENKFNIKKEYFLCGHSLGGFFASRYMLKYPKGIKKVLLLSPCGITDYHIKNTDMDPESNICISCCKITIPSLFWPCKLKVQNCYHCCCFHNIVKRAYGKYNFNIDEEEIKKNKDGSDFKVDKKKVADILEKLAILSLDYPNDIYECIYYIFAMPPPAVLLPIEVKLMNTNNKQIIFVFGKDDFMDKTGAYRLSKFNPDKYKYFTLREGGHSFALENPKELKYIIGQFF